MQFPKPLLYLLALMLCLTVLCTTLPILPLTYTSSPSNAYKNFNKIEATALGLFFYNSVMPLATSSIFSSSNAIGPDFTAKFCNITLLEANFTSLE